MIAPIARQAGIGTLEWIIVVLIILIGGSVVMSMVRDGEQKERQMEAASGPLIGALDRFRAANKSYPDTLEKLVPAYLQELPSCNMQSNNPIAYYVDKDSAEYFLNCGSGMFSKRRYSSKTKAWDTWD